MSHLYNRPFKVGFVATIVFFALLNLVAYLFATSVYDQMRNHPITWGPGPRFHDWGIPFVWRGGNLNYGNRLYSEVVFVAEGLFLNFVFIAAMAFLVGLVVRWFALRFR